MCLQENTDTLLLHLVFYHWLRFFAFDKKREANNDKEASWWG
jgi:hypothetical protein